MVHVAVDVITVKQNAEFQLEVGDCTVFISFLSELTESLSPGA